MRDRDRRRRAQAFGVPARQHACYFRLGKPPRVLKFRAVDDNFSGQGLGMAADHQRGRERPGLRAEIGHLAAEDAGFLAGFTPHRVLDRLARLEEAGEARPHGRPETRAAAEQAVLALGRQHDHHRIGAREMLGVALRTIALPAGADRLRRRAAVRAEAVTQMPMQHRLGLGDRRQMLGPDQPLHRDRAQVGDQEIVARLQRFRRSRRNAVAETGSAFQQAEENRLARGRQRARFRHREQRIVEGRALFHRDPVAADHIGAGIRLCRQPAPSRRHRGAIRRRARGGFAYSQEEVWGRDRGEGTLGAEIRTAS